MLTYVSFIPLSHWIKTRLLYWLQWKQNIQEIEKNHYMDITHIKFLLVFGEYFNFIRNDGVNCELTNNHSCADVTELGFLAVVVLKFVRFVIDLDHWLRRWRRRSLFFLHLFIIDKIHLRRTECEMCVTWHTHTHTQRNSHTYSVVVLLYNIVWCRRIIMNIQWIFILESETQAGFR